MKQKIISLILLITLLSFTITFALAEEILAEEDKDGTASNEEALAAKAERFAADVERQAKRLEQSEKARRLRGLFYIFFYILPAIFLIIGIFSTKRMIKHPTKIPNLIIHGLVFLGNLVMIISIINGTGNITGSVNFIWLYLPSIFFSGYIVLNLIKKENFANEKKYTIGLFSGGIILTILLIISAFSWYATIGAFREFGLKVGLFYLFGLIFSFILGIIGLFIDTIRFYQNKPSKTRKQL